MVDPALALTEMISAVDGVVPAPPGKYRSLTFPSVLATGAGGVQASTAADSSLNAPDEAPELLGDAVESGDAFCFESLSAEHPTRDMATTAAKVAEAVTLRAVTR
jgi:hypothetical protein